MLVLLGSNHRSAPVDVRERLAFSADELPATLKRLLQAPGIAEAFILSTCNRVEVLVRTDAGEQVGLRSLRAFLTEERSIDSADLDRYCYHHFGRDAVLHLFRVASSLDSMILGEPQILGQVKDAYRAAKAAGATRTVLERLLQECLSVAKRVRTETDVARNAVSVGFAAVELAGNIFGDLAGRRALLLGAGKMSELVARHLVSRGVRDLSVASRTYNHAVESAQRFGGHALNWEDGLASLASVDIVVSATGATRPILSKQDVARAVRSRRRGPLFLIDIAVPRDIDPLVNDLSDVYLYDIDGLQGVVESNRAERQRAAERAQELIVREVETFTLWRQSQEITPVIVALRETLLEVGQREIERFRRKLGALTPAQERAVEELVRGVIQKVLHRPVRQLQQAARHGDTATSAALYRNIFGLREPADPPRSPAGEAPPPAATQGTDDPPLGPRRLLKGGKGES